MFIWFLRSEIVSNIVELVYLENFYIDFYYFYSVKTILLHTLKFLLFLVGYIFICELSQILNFFCF